MTKPTLHLSRLNRSEVINLATEIKAAMTANVATFATPVPTMTALGTMITNAQNGLNAYLAAQQAVHLALTNLDNLMDTLRLGLTQEASYVGSIAAGNVATIQLAGMTTTALPTPSAVPAQVSNLAVSASDNDGELELQWDPVPGAASYEIQISPDPVTSTSWINKTPTTKSNTSVPGLTSGARIHLRVRAIGPGGEGAWSQEVSKIVP